MRTLRSFLLIRLFSVVPLLICGLGGASAQQPPPVITRPMEVWWGSYQNNEDLVGSNAAQWTNVQQQMDGYLLHGAYWNFSNNTIGSPSPDTIGPQLATILSNAGNKPVMVEALLAGEYPDVNSAFGYAYAGSTTNAAGFGNAIANIRRLKNYGFNLRDVSTDYIMSTWDRSVRFHPDWTSKEFFTAVTGDWDGYSGSIFNTNAGSTDRNNYGWFCQWVERIAQAFPDIRVSAVNSPVYFPWYEGTNVYRELGENECSYYTWLKIERRGTSYTTFYSGDGSGWEQLTSTNVELGPAPRAGFFVASLTNRTAEGRVDSVQAFPFYAQDIGDPGTPGRVTSNTTNAMSVVASGNNGLHPGTPSRDAQFFAYKEIAGDGTFTVRLDSLVGSNPGRTNSSGELPTAGLTLRESVAGNSRQVSLHGNASKQLEFLARRTTGGGLSNVIAPVAGQGTVPRWLRLVRSNSTVTALNSVDGSTWITNGSVTLTNLAAKLLVGLVADSQVTFETATAQFSQADFNGQAFPGVGFSGYTSTTIGSAGTASSSFTTNNGGVFTLEAAGAGAAGTADNLQFHHLAFSNDGTFYARLRHFADEATPGTPLNAGAQLGLMLRGDTAVSSPQIAVAFTPQHGLLTLSRAASNGPTVQLNQTGQGSLSIQPFASGLYRPLLRYFTGNDYLGGLHGAFPGSYSTNFAGFTTDSPYSYQAWGGSETTQGAIAQRRKIITYEQWLQARGREHHFIANSDAPGSFDTSTPEGRDSWDLAYKQQSMRSLQLHQMEGGRPDKVIFESWYEGPFTMVPETKNGAFANLARDSLLYVKGIGQSLDLHAKIGAATNTNAWVTVNTVQTNVSTASASPALTQTALATGSPLTFTLRLKNTGTVPALPVLHAHETGGGGWATTYKIGTNDVTASVTGSNGLPVTDAAFYSQQELVAAGASVDVEVQVRPDRALSKRKILLRAFWNPQDPSAAPRDALAFEVSPPVELIANGNFESGTTGWTANGGSIAIVSTNVHEGTNAIKATRSQAYQGPQQDILGRLVPGQTYRLTAWVKVDSSANFKATVAYVGTNTNTVFNPVATLTNVGTNWQAIQGYYRFTEPNGPASSLKLYFETTGSPTYTGPIYVDAVSLTLASPVWTDTLPGARGWNTTTSWQSGNAPVSFSGNSIAFFPSQTVSTGSITAIQNLGSNFLLNSLTLGGAAPTNGAAAAVGISSNSLAFVESDGVAARLALDATGTNLSYTVSAPLLLSNNLAVAGDGSANFVFNGAVTGTGALVKSGGSVLTLAASNGFSGGTSLDGGTVVAAANSALGTGGIIVAGGQLRGSLSASASLPNDLVLAGDIVTGGLLNIDGAVQLSGGNRTATVDSGTVAWRGPVSDDVARNLVKAGGGTLVLGGVNTYRGNTTINAGALRVNNGAALGSPGTSSAGYTFLAGGSVLATLEATGDITTDEVIKVAMHNTDGHWQIRNISGRNALRGPLLFEGGGSRWDIGSLGGTLELSGVLSNTTTASDTWRNLNLHGPGEGILTGPTGDTRSGTTGSSLSIRVNGGTWTLAGPGKTHRGTTAVAGGTLVLDSALVSPVVVDSGGTIAGSGSTTTNFTINTGATVLRRLTNWSLPDAALSATRFIGPANSNGWTIRIDGSGLTGFSETNKTIPVFSGALSNISLSAIDVAPVNFPGAGFWSVATNSSSLSLLYTAAAQDAYQAWSNSVPWNGRPSDSLEDPDSDGVPNLAEYAFGGDPLQPGDDGHPVAYVEGDRLKLTFRRIADPALTYEVFATEDLASPGTVIWSSTGAQNVAGPVTVTDTVTTEGRSKRFVRVRISR